MNGWYNSVARLLDGPGGKRPDPNVRSRIPYAASVRNRRLLDPVRSGRESDRIFIGWRDEVKNKQVALKHARLQGIIQLQGGCFW